MASSPSRQPAPASTAWIGYALAGLAGLSLGIMGTYLVLRPQLNLPAPQTVIVTSNNPAEAGPDAPATLALPPAGLTTGMAPAQAERTLGNFYYDQSNWSQAISHYLGAIRQGTDDADIRTDLGNAYQFAGQLQEALGQYQRAQAMNPLHEFSLFNQGGLYLNGLNNPAKAIAVWNEYLVRFPNGANAAAARQLIAQASGGAAPHAPVAANPALPLAPQTGNDATEARLLKLVAPAKPAKP